MITGEFGGDGLTALALPTTSGTGATPAIKSWVSCETGGGFSMGLDPHTLAAYQSPNGGDAIALMVNDGATQMVRVDLTSMLNPATVPAPATSAPALRCPRASRASSRCPEDRATATAAP